MHLRILLFARYRLSSSVNSSSPAIDRDGDGIAHVSNSTSYVSRCLSLPTGCCKVVVARSRLTDRSWTSSTMQAAAQKTCSRPHSRHYAFKSCAPRSAPHASSRAARLSTAQLAAHQSQFETSRRDLLGSSLLAMIAVLCNPAPAQAGLDRYVKKKKLDPLDTYVPLVLEARDVLAELDSVMVKDPSAARQLLRSGPFRGLRDNIRALGQYAALPAAEGGAGLSESDAGQLVSGFFQALEGYDLLLYNAVREYKQQEQKAAKDSSSDEDADASAAAAVDPAVGLDKAAAAEKLQLSVQKLDQLIATVPADVLAKSQQVLAKVTGKKVPVAAETS